MSADGVAVEAQPIAWEQYQKMVRVLRYAIGSTICVAIAMGVNWQLSYLLPVLALGFFGSTNPRPGLKAGVSFIVLVAISCLGGLWLSRFLLPYPLVFIPFVGLLLFLLFHARAKGTSPLVITWLMLALLVIPLLALTAQPIATLVAIGIGFGAVATVLIVWLSFGLFPDLRQPSCSGVPGAPIAPVPTQNEMIRTATTSTAAVLPVFVMFYTFQWTGSLLTLVFIALLVQQPGFATSWKAGLALILGNLVGGTASILAFEILVILPEYYFLLLLVLLAGLVFGTRVFSGKQTAPLYGMAFSTFLLILCSTTASGSGDASSKTYERVFQLMLAVIYVVGTAGLLNRLAERRRN